MTAIVRTWTPQGFVIAADGRSRGQDVIRTEKAQKICPLESPIGSFAFCMSGVTELFNGDNEETVVSLAEETRRAAEALRGQRTSNLMGLAAKLVRPGYNALKDVWESINPQCYPSQPSLPGERGETIFRLWLDGYRGEYPESVSVRIFHEKGKLCEPAVLPELVLHGIHKSATPVPTIGKILWSDDSDPRLSAYKGRAVFAEDMTLGDALEHSRLFIEAHFDPKAMAIDQNCLEVGGHIHIATITPQNGFRWTVPPKGP
jgi:hypothetical protein